MSSHFAMGRKCQKEESGFFLLLKPHQKRYINASILISSWKRKEYKGTHPLLENLTRHI